MMECVDLGDYVNWIMYLNNLVSVEVGVGVGVVVLEKYVKKVV